jgi:hypothetical protein
MNREEAKRQHEYLLQEIRLTGEDIKEHIHEKYEPRITSLEHWRSYIHGIAGACALIATYLKGGKILK